MSTIPAYLESRVIDEKGNWTPTWQKIIQQLLQELQMNISDEGIILPKQSAADIALLTGPQSVGALVYDSDADLAKVNIAGVFKTILTA